MQHTKKLFSVILSVILLSGCGTAPQPSDASTQEDPPHTFAGYPVVYHSSGVSPESLLAAYESLETSSSETTGIHLSETDFTWDDLTGSLEKMTGAVILEDNFSGYETVIFLTHFESHETVGFSGTVAHLASLSSWEEPNEAETLMQDLARYGNAAHENLEGQILYLAVYDGGVVASYDPVSLDQACVDMINMTEEYSSQAAHIVACGGIRTLVYAEQLGLGSRTYALLNIN